MNGFEINVDQPLWPEGPVVINQLTGTIVFTWIVMAILVVGSRLVTRRLSVGTSMSRGQNLLEVLVSTLSSQIREVSQQEPGPFLPFVGTLFIFIAMSNLLSLVPGFPTPTASLATTAALATCVFVAVPLFGIASQGVGRYLRQYVQPSIFMLPFNVIGELSRTLALAVRLYGNMMSGSVIGLILLGFVPLFVPIVMQLFGLLTGMIQAYIFAVLAMVYIASATQAHTGSPESRDENPESRG
ncbi:F0F1 ATP synthase subunit A [bacterium]|nr:F0F1 ATP synthase subunit A [bacterium]